MPLANFLYYTSFDDTNGAENNATPPYCQEICINSREPSFKERKLPGGIRHYLEENFLKVFAMLEAIQHNTKNINTENSAEQRSHFKCIPVVSKPEFDILPLRNIEDILEFDLKIVTDISFRSDFILYVSQCGGDSKKQNVIRVLRRVFDNKVAQECSWMGFRQNFKVGSLRLMAIIRDVVASNFPGTEKEFEEIASEWFRLAKQRYQREQKK